MSINWMHLASLRYSAAPGVIVAAGIGAVEEGIGPQGRVGRPHFVDQLDHALQRPHIEGAGHERHEVQIGYRHRRPLAGGVAAAGVDHDVIVLGRQTPDLGADGIAGELDRRIARLAVGARYSARR